MQKPRILTLSQHVFGWLLYTYPAKFRHRYGAEMGLVFDACLSEAYTQAGLSGVIRLWWCTLGDFLVNVPAVYLSFEQEKKVMIRRTLESVLAVWLLLVCLPFFPLIAVLIKLDSDGPIFFCQERVGHRGKAYMLYKLRSMTVTSDPAQRQITRVGKILRPLKIDELPQLVNVLKGDMSFFGPRPPLPNEVDMDNPLWQRILANRPGLLPTIK